MIGHELVCVDLYPEFKRRESQSGNAEGKLLVGVKHFSLLPSVRTKMVITEREGSEGLRLFLNRVHNSPKIKMNYGAAAPANMRKIIRFKKYETDNFAKKPIERAAGPILDMRKAQHNTKNGAIFALFAISGPARHSVRTGFAVFWS